MELYTCKYFTIQELVTPYLYNLFKDNEIVLWRMFDPNILMGADWLRENFGKMFINTWSLSSNIQNIYKLREESGIRHIGCEYYSIRSMHSSGRAIDALFEQYKAEEVRKELKKMSKVPYLKRVENGVSWLHIDTKPTGSDKLYFFNP